MPKVSVVLPSLDVAAYIRECMESVLGQTLWDIEVLCVDAGSTDGTYEILEGYAARDSRVRLIRSDKKSYGFQVNLGMGLARGEYLGIVETDDCIEPGMYAALYEAAEENSLDYVKAGFCTLATPFEGERHLLECPMGDTGEVFSYRYFTGKEVSPDIYIWNGLYRLSFLREHHVRLNESPGAAFQDCGFRYLTDMSLGRGMFLDGCFYRYRRDNAAASTYSRGFARFNLSECRYVRGEMARAGITDRGRRAFVARETVMMALSPYLTFRGRHGPDGGILSALGEFRQIMLRDRAEGLLRRDEMLMEHWVQMRLFTEKPESYEDYISVKAAAEYGQYGDFIRRMAGERQVVVACTGKAADFAFCLMRMNRLGNIVAVCDNDQGKWGERYMGHEVLPPAEAVRRFPRAHYLIANRACPGQVRRQLEGYGVREGDMSEYRLPLDAIRSSSLFVSGPGMAALGETEGH